MCLRFSSKETPLRVLRPRQADVKSALISTRPQARPRLSLSAREVSALRADGRIVCTGFLRCHCEPVRRLAWQSVPRARRRETPKPPSAREAARSAGGRDVVRPHPRCSSVGGDALIAPPSHHRTSCPFVGGDAHIAPPFSHHIPGGAEPSAPTHVLMCRVSVPCLSLWERWPSAARTERANHDHTGPLSHLR